jgi:uncharacterized membrane protein YkvA (DUF1232 family)
LSALDRFKTWARMLRRDVMALWLAARDPRTPWAAKAVAALVAAYALSPIDLIPDFLPIIGYLDDLVLVPLGIALAVRIIPAPLMAEFRVAALSQDSPRSWLGVSLVVLLWTLAAAWPWALLGYPLPRF